MKSDDVKREHGADAMHALYENAERADPLPPPRAPAKKGSESEPEPSNILKDLWGSLAERFGGIFTTPPKRREYLLTRPGTAGNGGKEIGVLARGKAGMLAAGGGQGKTMALAQLAVSVATGKPWLGNGRDVEGFTVPEGQPGRVLLALGEEDAEEIQRRLYGAAKAAKLNEKEQALAAARIVALPLCGVPVSLIGRNAEPTGLVEEIERRMNDGGEPWALVVLDPLSRFAGMETEESNAAATRFVQVVEQLLTMPGKPTVLVAHHTTKADRAEGTKGTDAGARGSSALSDGFRFQAQLRSVDDAGDKDAPPFVRFVVVKNNYAPPDPEGLLLVRDKDNDGGLRAATANEKKRRSEAVEEAKKAKRNKPATEEDDPGAAWRKQ